MRSRHDRFLLLLVTILACAAPPAVARSTLNPTSYTSPSGEYELFVEPSQPSGAGPALYRMTKSGEVLWQGNRRLTLRNALLTDDGFVAGCAYAGGVSIPGNHGSRYSGLTVLLFGPDGSTLLEDNGKEHETGSVHLHWSGSDSPPVLGLLMASERDWFAVRVPAKDPAPVAWWTYDFRAGRRAGDVTPAYPVPVNGWTHELDAHVIDEHPLVVVLWWRYEPTEADPTKTRSASITLVDFSGNELWRRDFPAEYDGLPLHIRARDLQQLRTEPDGFSFRSCSESARVFFEVELDATNPARWSVQEARREPVPPPGEPQAPDEPEREAITLEQLGTIVLETGEVPDVPFDDARLFAIGTDDSIGILSSSDEGDLQLVRVSMDGALLTRTFIDRLPGGTRPSHLLQIADGRWMALMTQRSAKEVLCTGWWINPGSGEVHSTGTICTGQLRSAVPTGDGGFLLHLDQPSGSLDTVARYGGDAGLIWSSDQPGIEQRFSFKSIQWLDDGTFIGLDNSIVGTIEYFDGNGAHLRSVAVPELIGAKPNYLSKFIADVNGGFILYDFNGTPPIYRIAADGTVTSKFQPRYADDRTLLLYHFGVDRRGRLWVSNRRSIMRLDAEGIVDRVLGAQPDDTHLSAITAMTIDHAGLLYAVDEATAAVHVFNPDGTLARRCAPLPTDFSDGSGASVTVDGRGDIYCCTKGGLGPPRYLHLNSDCTRLGFESLELRMAREQIFQPGSSRRWVIGFREVWLVSEDGTAVIDQRPDRNWLDFVRGSAVAPDGSLAVMAGETRSRELAICIYGRDGEPQATIPFDGHPRLPSQIAFNGTTVVMTDRDALLLCDVATAQWRRHALPEEGFWSPHITPDGRELLLRNSTATQLIRYRLPE